MIHEMLDSLAKVVADAGYSEDELQELIDLLNDHPEPIYQQLKYERSMSDWHSDAYWLQALHGEHAKFCRDVLRVDPITLKPFPKVIVGGAITWDMIKANVISFEKIMARPPSQPA